MADVEPASSTVAVPLTDNAEPERMLEADAPYQVDYDDRSDTALASLCREFTYNDIHARTNPLGTPLDRNTELLVAVR